MNADSAGYWVIASLLAVPPVPSSGAIPIPQVSDAPELVVDWRVQEVTDSAPTSPDPVGKRFAQLSAQWKAENRVVSSAKQRVQHPAYQSIMAMGPQVIPYLLNDLPNDWFYALWKITSADPVRPEDQGDVDAMTEAWRAWGIEQGYLPE